MLLQTDVCPSGPHWPVHATGTVCAAGCSKSFEPYGLYNPCEGAAEAQRHQQLVFIGQQLPRDQIVNILDSCLLSDQEISAGQGDWLSMKCPWDLLL